MKGKAFGALVLIILVSFIIAVFCPGFSMPVSSAEGPPYNKVFQRDYVSSVDGVSLPCSVYIPPYGVSKYMPVWVDLHALSGPGGIRFDWQEWARSSNMMVISPWGRNFKGLWYDGIEPSGTTREPCIFDDFAGGAAGWSNVEGNWARNSTDQCFQQSDMTPTWKTVIRSSSGGSDYSVSVDINELSASAQGISAAGIVFRRQGNGDCYWLDLVNSGQTKQLRLLKFIKGSWTPLAEDDLGTAFDLRVKHNMKLMTLGNHMEVRLDGQLRTLDASMTYHKDTTESPGRQDGTFESGDVGLVSFGGSHQFDNFRVQNEFLYGQKDLTDTFEQFLEEFSSDPNYRADPSRVYLSGFSVGGTGTWNLGLQYPDLFSALHPSVGVTDMYEEYKWMKSQRPDQVFNPNGAVPRYYTEQDFLYNEMTEQILGGTPGSATDINSRMHEFSARYILENALNMPVRIEHPVYDTVIPNNNGPMEVKWLSMDGLITATEQATTEYAQSQYPWNKWKTVENLTGTRKETALYGENGEPPPPPKSIWDDARYDTRYQGGGHGCCYYDWLWPKLHVNFFNRAVSDLGSSHVDPDEVAYKTYDDVRNKAWWLTIDIAAPNQDKPGLARVKRDKTSNTVQVHVKNVRTTILDLKRMGISMDPGQSLKLTVDNSTVESEPLTDTLMETDLKLTGEWDTAAAAAYKVKVNGTYAPFTLTPTSMTIAGVRTPPASEVLIESPLTQGNILTNAGFEQGSGDWTTSVSGGGQAKFEVNSQKFDAHSGTASARIKDAAAAGSPFTASYASTPVGVVPGQPYTLGAFVKTRALRAKTRVYDNGKYSVDEVHNARARIGLVWMDANGSFISRSDSAALNNTNDFKPLEVKTTAPPNAAYAQAVLKTESPDSSGITGSAWFDDVSLRRGYPVTGTIPKLSTVTPTSAVNNAEASVKLNGSGFMNGATARLRNNGQGVIDATDVSVDTGQITCLFNLNGAAVGDWDVEVSNSNGERAILTGGFKVNPPTGPLTVTAISPTSGTVGGTVPVTISGTGFLKDATVSLEASGATTMNADTVKVVSTTSLTCNLNLSGAQAVYDVVVTNPDQHTARKTGAFTVNAAAPACGSGSSGVLMFGLAMGVLAIAGLGPTRKKLRLRGGVVPFRQ